MKQHKDPNVRQESVIKDRFLSMLGIGLTAWEVDFKSVFELTKSLYPTQHLTFYVCYFSYLQSNRVIYICTINHAK